MEVTSRRARKRSIGRLKVGQRVYVPVGGRSLPATIIEDRGNLGVHGQQVVRLEVQDPTSPSEHFQVEVPADWIRTSHSTEHLG